MTGNNEKLDIQIDEQPLQDITNNAETNTDNTCTDTCSNTCTDEDQLRYITYLMLRHGVPFTFYHELCSRFKDLPRAYKV